MTAALTRTAFVLLAVVAVACIDTTSPSYVNQGQSNGIGGGSSGGGGGGGSGGIDTALVGTWIGPTTLDTVGGDPQTVNTTWEFTADGSVLRQVVTLDLTTGVTSPVISSGTWTAGGSSLTVSFTTPNPQNLSFTYTVSGSLLTLDQVQFVRTG